MNEAVTEELGQWDAVETVERLRRGDVSPREVIDAAIARAQSRSSLGAIVTESYDEARQVRPSGALAGVPTFIKDLAQVRGVRTAWGSRGTGEHVSRRSDPSIERLFTTGLVCLGKSATPEFGLTATTEPLGFPPCRNAWDPTRSAGGSSAARRPRGGGRRAARARERRRRLDPHPRGRERAGRPQADARPLRHGRRAPPARERGCAGRGHAHGARHRGVLRGARAARRAHGAHRPGPPRARREAPRRRLHGRAARHRGAPRAPRRGAARGRALRVARAPRRDHPPARSTRR
ncbi:MAG: amidase family protein [Sandaracinaceae bacterium]|nr:amidase family protein [Sandaracinaceae bacterium]